MKIEDKIKQKRFRNEYHRLLANLSYTYYHVMAENQKHLKPFGVSFTQFNVLSILRGQHPQSATVSLIKERILDKSSDVSRIVDRLLDKKLVTRNICPKDRRQVDIVITAKGLEVLKQIDGLSETFDSTVSALSDNEAKTINDLLDKIGK